MTYLAEGSPHLNRSCLPRTTVLAEKPDIPRQKVLVAIEQEELRELVSVTLEGGPTRVRLANIGMVYGREFWPLVQLDPLQPSFSTPCGSLDTLPAAGRGITVRVW